MRKKFLVAMLAGSMVASMAACGTSDTKKTTEAPQTVATTEEPTTAAKTTEEVTTVEETTVEETTVEETTVVETEEETTVAETEEETTVAETEEETTVVETEEETTVAETEEETTVVETEEETTVEETEEETTVAETEEEATGEETTEEAIDGTGIKVGMVTDVGGVNDGSFNESAWTGLQMAAEDFGVEVNYMESKTDSDYAPNIETLIDEDYDLIIITGYMLADALREAAELYPDQTFVIIDDASNAEFENVTCMMFEQAQASYLVGLAAGMATETDTVGFVLGMESETMNQFGYGYLAGVLDANADAKIEQFNANSFGDPAIGKTAVTNMVIEGADVVFHAAGGTGLGVIDGCKEAGIWAIGVDSDQSVLAPETVLTSAMKRVDNGCYEAIKAYLKGELESGILTYDLEMGGVDIAPTTDNLSDEILEAVEAAKEAIIAGEIVVPNNKEDFEEKYGDVYVLDSEE